MTDPPCGYPDCPVADLTPERLRALASTVWPAGTPLRRGHKSAFPDSAALVPGVGDTRFAPLGDTDHVYVATTSVAALLESALHDATPPDPRIRTAQLGMWRESAVRLTQPARLIDLRDEQLDRLGIDRSELVATSAIHYRCTRRWAAALRGRHIGGYPTTGAVWNSRQIELHARAIAHRPAVQELLTTSSAEVAVIWADRGAPTSLEADPIGGLGPLSAGPGLDFTIDLGATLQIPIL